jgi:dynein heavy chain
MCACRVIPPPPQNTREFSDGILATIYRVSARDEVGLNWVVCDGPVDAVWVENLNTVLGECCQTHK